MEYSGYQESDFQKRARLMWWPVFASYPRLLRVMCGMLGVVSLVLLVVAIATVTVALLLPAVVTLLVAMVIQEMVRYSQGEATRYANYQERKAREREAARAQFAVPATQEDELFHVPVATLIERYKRYGLGPLVRLLLELEELEEADLDAFHQEFYRLNVV